MSIRHVVFKVEHSGTGTIGHYDMTLLSTFLSTY